MAGKDNTEPAIDPGTLSAHAVALGLAPLEKPYTLEEAIETAGPDGMLVAVVEIPLRDLSAALAAGHAPDSLAVHAAQPGPTTLEKPMTAVAAAGEDGFLTAVVEVSFDALPEGRADE